LRHVIETRLVSEVDLKNDYYWVVPEDSMYNMNLNPGNIQNSLEVGSLASDYEILCEFVLNGNEPLASNFREAGRILIAVAQTLERSLAGEGG